MGGSSNKKGSRVKQTNIEVREKLKYASGGKTTDVESGKTYNKGNVTVTKLFIKVAKGKRNQYVEYQNKVWNKKLNGGKGDWAPGKKQTTLLEFFVKGLKP